MFLKLWIVLAMLAVIACCSNHANAAVELDVPYTTTSAATTPEEIGTTITLQEVTTLSPREKRFLALTPFGRSLWRRLRKPVLLGGALAAIGGGLYARHAYKARDNSIDDKGFH